MCGRYSHLLTWSQIVGLYRLTSNQPAIDLRTRLDIRPTTPVLIIRERNGVREAVNALWWLVPPWAKEAGRTYAMFNARAEGIDTKRSFAEPFRNKRCLIPASGFYEWKGEGKKRKTRYYITSKSGAPLTFRERTRTS